MKEPDKWCIKVTPENREAIEKWRTTKITLNCKGYCVNKNSFDDPSIGYWYPDKPSEYTEISFEEFKVYTSKPLKQAVHCETQEEWDFACDKYDKITCVKTQFGKEYNTFSYTSSFRGWNTKEYYIKENYQILSFQEWCDLNGYKIEKEVKFEVGKWYKNLGTHNQKNTFGKFKRLSGKNNNEFWMSECIYAGKQVKLKEQWLDYSSETIEASIEEIQQYLPDDHPDKIKSDIKFEVGDWVVNLEKSLSYDVNEICRVSKISKTLLACENKPQNGGYMKTFDKFRHATPEEIHRHLVFTGQIQQYSPNNHPDKIKSNQEFKVGDWVIVVRECPGYNGKLGKLYKAIENSDDGYFRYEKHSTIDTKLVKIRFATPEEINNHLISIEQIPAENYPFKPLQPEDLEWKIQLSNPYHGVIFQSEPISMTNVNWKPKMILSIDDEELPMVNIIKTNTIKQLLNND